MWLTRRSTTESAVNGKCHAHTSEPLAGCPRCPFRAQNMSQMQRLKHEQCGRRNRDIDNNSKRKYGDVDGAICHGLRPTDWRSLAHRFLVGYVYGRTRSQTGGLLQIWLLKRFTSLIAL